MNACPRCGHTLNFYLSLKAVLAFTLSVYSRGNWLSFFHKTGITWTQPMCVWPVVKIKQSSRGVKVRQPEALLCPGHSTYPDVMSLLSVLFTERLLCCPGIHHLSQAMFIVMIVLYNYQAKVMSVTQFFCFSLSLSSCLLILQETHLVIQDCSLSQG